MFFKFILTLLFSFFLSNHSFGDEKYNCSINDYRPTASTDKSLRSWVPSNITFFKTGNNINLKIGGRVVLSGVLKQDDEKRIEFVAKRSSKSKSGQLSTIRYLVTYFKSNKKIAISADPSGYRALGDAWGSCNVSYEKTTNSNKISEDSGGNVNSTSWSNVRASGSSDLYLDETMNSIKMKSSNKWYDKLHERYKKNPETDIRIGFYFTNDKKFKPKKYEFEKIKPKSVKAYKENFINIFEFETNDAKRLLSTDYKYILFLVMDYEQGMYFYTRTTKVNN